MSEPADRGIPALEPLVFAVFQTGARADGGVESITRVVEGLRGHERTVITQLETSATARWRRSGAAVTMWDLGYRVGESFWRAGLADRVRRVAALIRTNTRTFRLMRRRGATLLHCNDILALWHTALGARLARARVIFNIRGTLSVTHPPQKWKWLLVGALTHRQIVLSEEMRSFWAARLALTAGRIGRAAARIAAIYSIVDVDATDPPLPPRRAELRGQLGIPHDGFAIAYVAAFTPRKQQHLLIEEFARAHAQDDHAHLYCIGDSDPGAPAYAQCCRDAVSRSGLERQVHFTGFTPAITDWYRAVDVTVVASQSEGLARCMIESIACGTPVVSFDVCSAREILQRHNCGIVVRAGDHAALFQAVARLRRDPQLRHSLGARGRELAATLFAQSEIVAQYVHVYRRVVAGAA